MYIPGVADYKLSLKLFMEDQADRASYVGVSSLSLSDCIKSGNVVVDPPVTEVASTRSEWTSTDPTDVAEFCTHSCEICAPMRVTNANVLGA